MSARSLAPWAFPILMLAMTAARPAEQAGDAGGYRLDPVHTRVLLGIDHAGFTTALGTVSGSSGAIAFDPADWSEARLRVSVPLQRLDFGDADWNRAALEMLDAERFPQAVFVSERVERENDTHARACGTLTLHGTSAPFCLDVRFNQLRRAPLPPFARRIGFSATGTLSRSAFGIDAWRKLIGDEVTLRIEVEAERDDAALSQFGVVR